MSHDNPQRPSAVAIFFGWLLMAIGGLMVLLCGACTLTFWGIELTTTGGGDAAGGLLMVGLIGGLPTAAGALLFWVGLRMVRPRKMTRRDAEDTFN
jgi:small neutral amino acid transporter SnatA (MarC family)